MTDDVPGQLPMFPTATVKPSRPKPSKAPDKPDYTLSGPAGELYVADCGLFMFHMPGGTVDLAFADPPFNIGHDYGEGFIDRVEALDYTRWTHKWVYGVCRLLRPGGALFAHVPDHAVADVYTEARSYGMEPVNWIVLHQEFGQYGESRFITSKVHCLYFVKPGGPRTWNVTEVLEPSLRLKTDDARTATAKYKGMRPMLDVWFGENLGRVQGNNKERWGKGTRPAKIVDRMSAAAANFTHPNQLPELYLARIVRCASNEDDLVFDPFTGSGTSWAVSRALGRRWRGCELLDYVAESAYARVKWKGCVRDVKGTLHNGPTKIAE